MVSRYELNYLDQNIGKPKLVNSPFGAMKYLNKYLKYVLFCPLKLPDGDAIAIVPITNDKFEIRTTVRNDEYLKSCNDKNVKSCQLQCLIPIKTLPDGMFVI